MTILRRALVAASCIASVFAVDIVVQNSGGNLTGQFGFKYGYGFLHEDINNSGDGGIYAELIQNRAFQYSRSFSVSTAHYFPVNGASLSIQELEEPLSKALPASMRVAVGNGTGKTGFKNEGYWGMDVRQQKYTGSFWVKGAYEGTFVASLESNLTSEVFGSVDVPSKSVADEWTEHTFDLTPEKDAPNSNNTFSVTFDPAGVSGGALDFNLISLFPPTYKGRKNGLRIDIAEALADMNPHVLRFPGGNMLEGLTNDTYWDWKNSIGPLKERPGFQGVWGYQQTNGLGLMEYLEWSEDMGLERVLAVWAGLALNGDTTPEEDLQPFIDDALNEIEFVCGPADSPWGKRRAELGHPEPFTLNYVEIGNEDWLAGYPGGWDAYRNYRFPLFYEAIKAAYPDIQIISSSATTDPENGIPMDYPEDALGDYHPYREPNALVDEFDRFDNDIGHIIGEMAATHPNGGTKWQGQLMPYPWWIGAVGEAVSLIGYERNSDRIPGTFYAPVLKNENRFQWSITLLQFAADPKMTTKAVTWYCWSLFAHHPITHTLPTLSNSSYGPTYWGAGVDETRNNAMVWKGAVYNTTNSSYVPVSVHFQGVTPGTKANLTVLTNPGGDPFAYNDPFTGVKIVNTTTTILEADFGGAFKFVMPQLSVAVLDTDVGSAGGNGTSGNYS
ncbi:glycoside hydrolase superfamily [Ampelomyces quisqualis]|uniref:non-reducing end alpha-L-arabinofuranosidase n=1 Tax=Ampelomyces quisqualis TaxID=50730 RepID=A0A6A5QV06_AMPQU|nr:glycoside hydrolase superfamily [Ampelomyces quisqualis]